MDFRNFPLIYEVLHDEGLKPVDVASNGNLICINKTGDKFLMKGCRGVEERVFTQVFPKIRDMKLDFKTLLLPEYLKIITKEVGDEKNKKKHKFIFVNFYEGTSFNKTWNEGLPDGYGGRGVNREISNKVVTLLEDFLLLDVKELDEFNLLTFDFKRWLSENMPYKTSELIKGGVVTKEQVDKSLAILNSPDIFQHSKVVLTNGDFYPRNFIELSNGKIVVIDWEGREDYEVPINVNGTIKTTKGQRNAFVNYVENHAAFFYVHMWGNPGVQKDFLKSAIKKFNISIKDLQAALIIKSLEQSLHFLPASKYLAVRQAELFVNSLDKEFVKSLVS